MAGLFTPEIRTDEAAQARVREWVAALRSGKYAQAKGYLHTPEGFCCLGVACDITPEDLGGWQREGNADQYPYADWYPYEVAGVSEFLPDEAVELYRLSTEDGAVGAESLATLNDRGYTFAEIADVIEREFAEALA